MWLSSTLVAPLASWQPCCLLQLTSPTKCFCYYYRASIISLKIISLCSSASRVCSSSVWRIFGDYSFSVVLKTLAAKQNIGCRKGGNVLIERYAKLEKLLLVHNYRESEIANCLAYLCWAQMVLASTKCK